MNSQQTTVNSQQTTKIPNGLISTLILILSLTTVIVLQMPRLESLTQQDSMSSQQYQKEAQQAQLNLRLLKALPSFGFKNLKADWAMLRFLQYFGDIPARTETGYDLTLKYFEIILENDPRFLDAYTFLATSGTLYAAQPEETHQLMEEGIKQLTPKVPQYAYYALRQQAINELLFLGKPQQAQETFEKAAKWAEIYDDPKSQEVVEVSRQTAQFLAENPTGKRAQISAWLMVIQESPSPETQKIAIQQIQALGGKLVETPDGRIWVEIPEE